MNVQCESFENGAYAVIIKRDNPFSFTKEMVIIFYDDDMKFNNWKKQFEYRMKNDESLRCKYQWFNRFR